MSEREKVLTYQLKSKFNIANLFFIKYLKTDE